MAEDSGLSGDERAELDALRAEVGHLRKGAPTDESGGGRRSVRAVRWTVSATLAILAAVLAIPAVAARFAHGELLDTSRYVETVAPLASDPAVQDAVATKVSDAIIAQLDLESLVQQALTGLTNAAPRIPAQVVGLAPVLANQANGYITKFVSDFVHSDAFVQLWTQANTVAHTNVVSVLTGGTGTALTANANGEVSIQLGPIIDQVKQRLTAQGLSFAANIPEVNASFVVFESPQVVSAQRATRALDRVSTWLPLIVLVLAVASVAAAPPGRRRRAVIVVSAATAVAMLILGVGIAVGRGVYLNAVPAETLPPAAASSIFDHVVVPLRGTVRLVLAIAVVVGAAAYLSGHAHGAVATRRATMRGLSWITGGRAGDATREPSRQQLWVARYAVALTVALVVAGALVLVFWRYPTGATALWVSLVVLILVVAVWVDAAPARRAVAARPSPPTGDEPAA